MGGGSGRSFSLTVFSNWSHEDRVILEQSRRLVFYGEDPAWGRCGQPGLPTSGLHGRALSLPTTHLWLRLQALSPEPRTAGVLVAPARLSFSSRPAHGLPSCIHAPSNDSICEKEALGTEREAPAILPLGPGAAKLAQ